MSRIWKLIPLGLFVLIVALSIDLYLFERERHESAAANGEKRTETLRTRIDKTLVKVENDAKKFVKDIEKREPTEEEVVTELKRFVNTNPNLLGATIAYQPFARSPDVRLFSRYFDKNQQKMIALEDLYDYTDEKLETSRWYTKTIAGQNWSDPYFGKASNARVTDFNIPFKYTSGPRKGEVRGVVALTIAVEQFASMVRSMTLGNAESGLVVAADGFLLAHTNSERIGKEFSEDDIKELVGGGAHVARAVTDLKSKAQNSQSFVRSDDELDVFLMTDVVPATSWVVAVVFLEEDLLPKNRTELKRKYVHLSLAISLFLFCVLALYFNRDFLSDNEAWVLSAFASAIFLSNTAFVGYLTRTSVDEETAERSAPISDNYTLDTYVGSAVEADPALRVVPTGIHVDRMSFEDAYDLNVSGTVWQRYDLAWSDQVTVGISFPQASPHAESVYLEEVSREKTDDALLVRYEFRCTLRLNFSYSDYPFDERHLGIRIEPANRSDALLLVPDLESYAYTNRLQKPGLHSTVDLPGNDILDSYFNFAVTPRLTNYGVTSLAAKSERRSLVYNVGLRRVLINAFVSYLIPIFVVLLMAFVLIVATDKPEEPENGGVVESTAAFLFVLVFSHIDLRKTIETPELMYMEYFYFISYGVVLFTAIGLVVYTRTNNRFIDFRHNLLMKTLFAPMVMLASLLVTLFQFY